MMIVTTLLAYTPSLFHLTKTAALAQAGWWGYVIVLCGTLGESLPFIGMPIPGQMILIAAGFISKTHLINPFLVFLCAAIGAIGGDWIGYGIGKHYGYDFARRYARYVFLSHDDIDRLAATLRNHAGKSLILGRFNSFTRAFAPFAAGISHVPHRTFLIYNICGGILWAATYTAVGYFFGHSYTVISRSLHEYVFWALVLLVLLFLLWKKYHTRATRRASSESLPL